MYINIQKVETHVLDHLWLTFGLKWVMGNLYSFSKTCLHKTPHNSYIRHMGAYACIPFPRPEHKHDRFSYNPRSQRILLNDQRYFSSKTPCEPTLILLRFSQLKR